MSYLDYELSHEWEQVARWCNDRALSDVSAEFVLKRTAAPIGPDFAVIGRMFEVGHEAAGDFVDGIYEKIEAEVMRHFNPLHQKDGVAMQAIKAAVNLKIEMKKYGSIVTVWVHLYLPWGSIQDEFERRSAS